MDHATDGDKRAAALAPDTVEVASGAPSVFSRLGGRSWLPRLTLFRHLLLLVLAAVVAILVLEANNDFVGSQIGQVAYYAIAAGGLTVLTGLNGQISLGHGALMAIGAYTAALFLSAEQPLPLPLILLIATMLTAVVGVLVGVAAARLHGPYLAGATLALAVGLPGLALYFKGTLGGEQGLPVRAPLPPEAFKSFVSGVFGNLGTGTKWLAYVGVACLLITYFLLANLGRSRVGRTWRAVRDQEVAAELAGISLGAWRVLAFVVSAACAGLGGAVLGLVVRLAAPGAFTLVLSLTLLTAIVIGGLGSLFGALLGSAILVFLPPYITQLGASLNLDDTQSAQLAPFAYGIVLVLAIIFAPAGIVGTIRLRWLRSRGRRAARTRSD